MWITAIIFFVLVVLDQLSKFLVVRLDVVDKVVIPNVLTIDLTYNKGAAWGMLDNNTWVLCIISFIATIALGYLCRKNDWKHGKLGAIALTMALAGCVGNLFDRFFTVIGVQEGVVDMISFTLFDKLMSLIHLGSSIFNVADAFLVVGLILFCIDYIFFYDKRQLKYGPKPKTITTPEVVTDENDPDMDSPEDFMDDELEDEAEKEENEKL